VGEPDGMLNANGIVAAAIRIYRVKAPREDVRKTVRRLVSLYKEVLVALFCFARWNGFSRVCVLCFDYIFYRGKSVGKSYVREKLKTL